MVSASFQLIITFELIITIGAVQSNHARQTAAACTLLGLKCLIILEQRLNDPPETYMKSGNVFLDKLFSCILVVTIFFLYYLSI